MLVQVNSKHHSLLHLFLNGEGEAGFDGSAFNDSSGDVFTDSGPMLEAVT